MTARESRSYEPAEYWNALHEYGDELAIVGYPELATSFNRAMYRAMQDAAVRALRAGSGKPSIDGDRVLDVGAGVGVWTKLWVGLGAEVTALELSHVAADRLRSSLPDVAVVQGDISEAPKLDGSFDLVTSMSVMLHITDDSAFRASIANIGRLLRGEGRAIFIDPIVVHRWWGPPFDARANSKARTLREWRLALDAAGLEIRSLEPVTAVLASAVDTRHRFTFRLLWLYWNVLTKVVGRRERIGAVAGALLRPLDRALMAAGAAPSTKCLAVTKRAG